MLTSKPVKIFLAISIVILLVAVIFIVVKRRSSTNPAETSNTLPQAVNQPTPTLPQASQQMLPVQKPSTEESYQIEKQTLYSYDALQNDLEIKTSVQNVKGDFKPDDIGVSSPSATTKLKNGNEVLILSGCTPHFCGGSGIIIAYDKADKKSYLLVEKIGSAAGYEIFGNPPEEIKNLLIYYFFHQ